MWINYPLPERHWGSISAIVSARILTNGLNIGRIFGSDPIRAFCGAFQICGIGKYGQDERIWVYL